MIEQLKITYTNYRWAKFAVFVGLLCCGMLLYWLSGGFPPWAWRFLFQVLPEMPHLWEAQGSAILIPFIGLLLLSISLLLIWAILLLTLVRVVIHWWQDFHERQHFAMDLQAAERLAEQITVPGLERERQATPATLPRVQKAALNGAASSQQSSIAARSVRVSHNVLSATGTSSTFSLPATQVPRQRRVHIPPAARVPSMREQLRLVSPLEDELDDEPQEMFDDEQYDVLRDIIAEQETVPEHEELWDDELEEEQLEEEELEEERLEEEEELEEERPVYSELDEPTLPAIRVRLPPEEEAHQGVTRLVVGVGLDAGILRKDAPNEDNLCAVQGTRITNAGPEEVGLFAVADGMGGHAHGQEASKLAIQTMSDVLVPALLHGGEDEENFSDLLKDGVHRANLAIYRRNREREEEMMGTTLTAALVVHTTAYVVNVGDSRTYLYRLSDGLQAITRDHSLVARMVESGAISREEMYTHPRRNQVYRCLGDRATVEVDTFVVTLQAGDLLLLCSDGLWEMVRDERMSDIIGSALPHPSQISAMLVQAALSEGGADNVSVIAVYVAQDDE